MYRTCLREKALRQCSQRLSYLLWWRPQLTRHASLQEDPQVIRLPVYNGRLETLCVLLLCREVPSQEQSTEQMYKLWLSPKTKGDDSLLSTLSVPWAKMWWEWLLSTCMD